MNIKIFKQEFDCRHDWDIEEEIILKNNWPQIKFYEIPTAWIIPIDNMLRSLGPNISLVKEIRQEYGQLIVIHDQSQIDLYSLIKHTDNIICDIDIDLHFKLKDSYEFEDNTYS